MIQKIINKEINANAKHTNTKMHMETTIMESFQYYSWCSILFCFYFCFIDRNLYKFLVFLKIIQISCESYMYRKWEGVNVKARYEFNNDPIKNVFST